MAGPPVYEPVSPLASRSVLGTGLVSGKCVYQDLGFLLAPCPGLPTYSGRWDQRQTTVDIDLVRSWGYESNFQGHHCA
jgi:hypothetical protein